MHYSKVRRFRLAMSDAHRSAQNSILQGRLASTWSWCSPPTPGGCPGQRQVAIECRQGDPTRAAIASTVISGSRSIIRGASGPRRGAPHGRLGAAATAPTPRTSPLRSSAFSAASSSDTRACPVGHGSGPSECTSEPSPPPCTFPASAPRSSLTSEEQWAAARSKDPFNDLMSRLIAAGSWSKRAAMAYRMVRNSEMTRSLLAGHPDRLRRKRCPMISKDGA